jgi:hypothetical protein
LAAARSPGVGNDTDTIALGIQLGSAALLVIVMTLIHGLGLVGISRLFDLRKERLEERDFNFGAVALMCGIALSLFTLHMVEITIFALFYMLVGAIGGLEEALSYSASTYATLGRTEEYFPQEWRLIGSIEALIGFLLIGWSTAFIVRNVSKLSP